MLIYLLFLMPYKLFFPIGKSHRKQNPEMIPWGNKLFSCQSKQRHSKQEVFFSIIQLEDRPNY
jgi:hypothetical protein